MSDGGFQRREFAWVLAALLGLHGCMSASRMASSLAVLQQGHAEWVLGALMSLYSLAPIALSLWAGRMADRHGFHRPVRMAAAMGLLGAALPMASLHVASIAVSGLLIGGALSVGAVAVQRQAGLIARDTHDLKRVFSWVALAPALSNSVLPVVAGVLIDHVGFVAAFALALLLPLLALWACWQLPLQTPAPSAPGSTSGWRTALDLMRMPVLRNVLLVNVAMAAAWDAHSFTVPVVGHAAGMSASAIGLVLGAFALATVAVRVVISAFAQRINEAKALRAALILCTLTLLVYPWLPQATGLAGMMLGSAVLGTALGSVQPMVMSTLHQAAPAGRHGQALGLRMMFTNAATIVMPAGFGVLAAATVVGAPMWLMAALLLAAQWPAQQLRRLQGAQSAAD
jgi:MFS family permease